MMLTQTCMVRACHTLRQPLRIHPSGHLGGWATPWSAGEMLARQYQRVDVYSSARIAYKRPPAERKKKLEEDLC